ncbi:MAG: biotin--[acetyl-CoA-carboxylase] ligase [Gemmatimonadetes bacterium]|nr:biotin--[acetyl-CoA-carboxylase] ligase [Gemmatimonadota bacterium]
MADPRDALDALDERALAQQLRVPRLVRFATVASTMDEVHALGAAGEPAGACVLADAQAAGRGRGGKTWSSEAGAGLWLSLLERPETASGLDVLSLRLGLAAAPVLEAYAPGPVRLKWPNDLYVAGGKLAGILVEARWHGPQVEWVTIGIGVNLAAPPSVASATSLRAGTRRLDVLRSLVPALLHAAELRGPLSGSERAEYASRDFAVGRRCLEPAPGLVRGITDDGPLIIVTDTGESHFRGGSLVLAEETP